MAERDQDDKFIKILDTVVQRFDGLEQKIDLFEKKVDGMASEVRTNSFKLDRLEAETGIISRKSTDHDKRFDMVDTSLEILREQTRMVGVKIDEVAIKVMEIDKRLKVVEAQLSLMETKLTTLEDETRQIRLELNDLNDLTETGAQAREQLKQLELRVFQVEEKIAA